MNIRELANLAYVERPTVGTAEQQASELFRGMLGLTSKGVELMAARGPCEQRMGPHFWRSKMFDHVSERCTQASNLTRMLQLLLQPGDDLVSPFVKHDGDVQCGLSNICDSILMTIAECVHLVEMDTDEATTDFYVGLCRTRSMAAMALTVLVNAGRNSMTAADLARWACDLAGGSLDLLVDLLEDCAFTASDASQIFLNAHSDWLTEREGAAPVLAQKTKVPGSAPSKHSPGSKPLQEAQP